ncbi:MAG: hypothetical protein KC931_16545 [Candidatus Omnitrophica bacterium]|nr:hypothetical protein [Candidatus Omnitrophota bacterium]
MNRRFLSVLAISLALATFAPGLSANEDAPIQISTFWCDITPPLGHPLCGGWIMPVVGFDDPEYAKGIVLKQGDLEVVLCSLDWCQLRNRSYDYFRETVGKALDIPPSNVAVQCVHQHNAPIVDLGVESIIPEDEEALIHADYDFIRECAHKIADAAKDSREHFHTVTHIGTSKGKVEKVASTRRLLQPDGSIIVRYSSAKEPEIRAMPEGRIDPWLRTVSFYQEDKPLARLHYYATHPQSYYGDGRTTYEFPGIARERLQEESGVFQIYFTGCAGDVAAGKYNDGTPEARVRLTDEIYKGLVRSVSATEIEPVGDMAWDTYDLHLPGRTGEEYTLDHLKASADNEEGPKTDRLKSALGITWFERVQNGEPIEINCLSLGDVRILHLPGEPMVEFQFEAQKLGGDDLFVAVAGYGDCGMGYICTEKSYEEGGYEPSASLLDPSAESVMKEGIAKLLEETAKD